MITDDFSHSVTIGAPAPGFRLQATDGQIVDLAEQTGPCVVFFTCNHCPYVMGWEKRVHELCQRFGAQVRWFGINANDPARHPDDAFERMVERAARGLPYAYLHDSTQEVARAWGAQVTPEFFVLDARHQVAYHGRVDESHQNPAQAGAPTLALAIEAVLAGRAPEPATTPVQGCSIKWRDQGLRRE